MDIAMPFPDPLYLHENLKPIVWSLKIVGKEVKKERDRYGKEVEKEPVVYARACGFSVSSNGYIMTCASIFMEFDSNKMEIRARRLDQDIFKEARLESSRPQWDLTLLKVETDDCECGSFAKEGTLRLGQPILYIGRDSHFVGSCKYGKVAVGCTNMMSLPPSENNMKCQNFKFDPYCYTTSLPPNTSNMGCFWNKKFFDNEDISLYQFEKQLHPYVPVIHCDGFSTNYDGHFGSPESPGSPVFNLNGDIVGMLSSKFENFDIAVHLSALLQFKTDSIAEGSTTVTKVEDDPIEEGSAGSATKKTRKQ